MFVMSAAPSPSPASPASKRSAAASGCVTQADYNKQDAAAYQTTSRSLASTSLAAELPDAQQQQTTTMLGSQDHVHHREEGSVNEDTSTSPYPQLHNRSRMKSKRIKAKYARQGFISYARLRELKQHSKLSKLRRKCEPEVHVPNGTPFPGRKMAGETRTPQTPDVTSSTRDNEARIYRQSETLGLSKEPREWSAGQVQQWLNLVVDDFFSRHLATLTVDGALLCLLSRDQLRQRIPDFATFMADALDTWIQEASKAKSPLVSSTETAQPLLVLPQKTMSPRPQPSLVTEPTSVTQVPQNFSPKPQSFSPKPQSFSPKPQSFSPKTQSFSPKPQRYSPKPQSVSPRPQSVSPRPQCNTSDRLSPKHGFLTHQNAVSSPVSSESWAPEKQALLMDTNANYDKLNISIDPIPGHHRYNADKHDESADRNDTDSAYESTDRNSSESSPFEDYTPRKSDDDRLLVTRDNQSDESEDRGAGTTRTSTQVAEQNSATSSNTHVNRPIAYSPERQSSLESDCGLVIDEFATSQPSAVSTPIDIRPQLRLEAATEAEEKYIAQECLKTNLPLQQPEQQQQQQLAERPKSAHTEPRCNSLSLSSSSSSSSSSVGSHKRRKSENERLKGLSKKLKLKITPQNSLDKDDGDKKPNEALFQPKDPHSAPVLDAFNRGYQDAAKLRELILKNKLAGLPFTFPSLLTAVSPLSELPPGPPKLDIPNIMCNPVPMSPHTPVTPHSPSPLTPLLRSPVRRRSPLAASALPGPSIPIKQEPSSPAPHAKPENLQAVCSSPAISNNFLKVPEFLYSMPSPVGLSPSIHPPPQHDPDKPLDLSTDSKWSTPIPTPSPSALRQQQLLPRSFSMPLGAGLEGGNGTPTHGPLPPNSSSATVIHPLALSGSSFTRQMSVTRTPEPGSMPGLMAGHLGIPRDFVTMSSVEGDSDPTSETETPSANVGTPTFSVSSPTTGNVRIGRIKLWEFLLELLSNREETCISWLNEPQGIFKIQNSERVASLWGKRKGLSSMNYDKLSRSIRQYYKQGIIKKTNDSKRLVYQFDRRYIDIHSSMHNHHHHHPHHHHQQSSSSSSSSSPSSGGSGSRLSLPSGKHDDAMTTMMMKRSPLAMPHFS